jgi:protease-4
MKTAETKILASVMLLIAACWSTCGCGQNVGWVIKPVPTDEALRETVIAADSGLFVADKILVLDVDGLLFNQRRGGLFALAENPVALFTEKLDKARMDPNVKAVVLRVNSPGGGVTASDIMYEQLRRFRGARGIPVVAVIEDVGASGGYYVACAADKIIAHPTSVTGSIGTMVQTVSVAGTMKLLRIDAQAVTSGPRKDMASAFKPLDPEDLAILKQMVDEYHGRFLSVVAKSRTNLTSEQIKALADGRVYTGEQAKQNGLVDDLGYIHESIAMAKEFGNLDRVKVVMYDRPLGYRANAYSRAPGPTAQSQVNLVNISADELFNSVHPQFLYLWTGHTNR